MKKKTTTRKPVLFSNVSIEGGFWGPRLETNRSVTMPIEYGHLKKTGRLAAWELKWKTGDPDEPHIFWDSDVAKWMEAAAYSLVNRPDPALEKKMDRVIAQMEKAQRPDGYLNTHYIAVEPRKRWTNLRDCHELYCAGHLMEAAVAHYHATGKRSFLDVMCRYADHIDKIFGPRRGQMRGYPGHQEIELALVKLSDATGEQRYLDLAEFFINERGRKPHYFDKEARARGEEKEKTRRQNHEDEQSHVPVREQKEVVGHAVRAMYMYCGMADVAAATGDKTLLKACKTLWHNVTRRRMHVTGGIGPTSANEGFTTDYDMPTENAYLETCSAIGLVFWANRMLQAELDGDYGDVMELALYNGVLSGVSLEGDSFFYANPLAVHPGMNARYHVGPKFNYRRSHWFGCACCPTNVTRLLASLGSYIYSTARSELCVHLYVNGQADVDVAGQAVILVQQTDYPRSERVRMKLKTAKPATFSLALRIPGWCHAAKLKVNGKPIALKPITRKGYARVKRSWSSGDKIDLLLPMPGERIVAPPAARQVCGRVALKRGPVVYCLESIDNGEALNDVRLPRKAALTAKLEPKLLGGAVVLRATALRRNWDKGADKLYSDQAPKCKKAKITAIPYALWAHRKPGEMLVWIQE
jgi:DUF1680 family protein